MPAAFSLTHLSAVSVMLQLQLAYNDLFSQCVAPSLVSTNMSNMRVGPFVKSAEGFVREALNTVGHSSYTNGCLSHNLQVRVTRTCCVIAHTLSAATLS